MNAKRRFKRDAIHHLPMQMNPCCGYVVDTIGTLTGAGGPEEGDYIACMSCGEILRFQMPPTLAIATNIEIVDLALHQPADYDQLRRFSQLCKQRLAAEGPLGRDRAGKA